MCAVNRVQLGELLDYEQPTRYIVSSTDYDDAYDIPVLTAGQTFILGYTNETEGIYKASKSNPVIIFDDFVTSYYLVDFDFKVKSSALKILKPKKDVNIYYVYYAMLGINFVPKEHTRHWISKYSQFEIAYPTLAKQQEIVSHLDTFTTLISNLESELDMRRKQYEHYRNQLLDISEKDIRYIVPFGDICKIIRGNGVQKADFVEEGIGCIHYGQIYTHYGSYTYTTNRFVSQDVFNKAVKASKGDIIMTDTSENVEDICKSVAYLGDEDIAVSNHSFIIKHNQNPKYLSFCTLTNSFGLQKKKVVFGAKVSTIKQDNLAKIKIFLPSLDEQLEIVKKLDAFENLIQSLEQEIKLRKQQYEYYREKLLTFEKE